AWLQDQMQRPDLWSHPDQAKKLGQELSTLRAQVEDFTRLQRQIEDLAVLARLAQDDPARLDPAELASDAQRVHQQLQRLELMTLLSGEHDASNAIVSVHAGAGGTDSQDWAQMLLRMYARWAERRGFTTEIVDLSPGEEAGIKSATMIINGHTPTATWKGDGEAIRRAARPLSVPRPGRPPRSVFAEASRMGKGARAGGAAADW